MGKQWQSQGQSQNLLPPHPAKAFFFFSLLLANICRWSLYLVLC